MGLDLKAHQNENFRNWACSFSGCEGGYIKSPIWICGIEWGFSKEKGQSEEDYQIKLKNYYSKTLKEEIGKGKYTPEESHYDVFKGWDYQYGQKVAKLYTAIQGGQVSTSYEAVKSCTGSEIFRLNLYPIAFPNEWDGLWRDYNLHDVTGFESKQIFRTWCFLHRFPWIASQVREHEPKLIIGTGIGYLTDFIVSSGGADVIENIHQKEISVESESGTTSNRKIFWAKIGAKTTLVVTPFFGSPYGLNSDKLIQAFGEKIRELANF